MNKTLIIIVLKGGNRKERRDNCSNNTTTTTTDTWVERDNVLWFHFLNFSDDPPLFPTPGGVGSVYSQQAPQPTRYGSCCRKPMPGMLSLKHSSSEESRPPAFFSLAEFRRDLFLLVWACLILLLSHYSPGMGEQVSPAFDFHGMQHMPMQKTHTSQHPWCNRPGEPLVGPLLWDSTKIVTHTRRCIWQYII